MSSELRVNKLTSRSGVGTVTFNDSGLIITGIATAAVLDITGSATAASLSITGNATIAGVLSYDDVTNVDSVGIITARSDLSIADKIIHTGDTNTAIRFPAADTVSVETAGSERLRIDSSGRLLVGHSTSTLTNAKLQVVGPNSNSYIMMLNTTASDSDGAGYNNLHFRRRQSGGEETTSGMVHSSHDGTADDQKGKVTIWTNDGSGVQERMRIDSSGRMGLGTNSPEEILHVKASSETVGSRDGVLFESSSSLAADTGLPLVFTSHIGNAANYGVASIAGRKENVTSGNGAGYLQFSTGSSGGAISEKMRIDSSGRLLVGTTTAGESTADNLTIADSGHCGITLRSGTSSVGTMFFADGTSGNDQYRGLIQYDHSGNFLKFATTAQERMRINANGYSLFKGNASSYYNSTGSFHQFQQNTNSYVGIFNNAHSTPYGIFIKYDTTPNNTGSSFIECEDSSAGRFRVVSNGGIYNYSGNNSNLSDEREKKNIVSLDTKWDKVKSWDLKKFHYNDDADTDDLRYGVIAQQVETVCPEVLSDWEKQRAEDAVLDDEGNVVTPAKEQIIRKGVKEQQMMWMAIKALQEAQARIETLETEVSALKAG
tara:strand:+ start:45 stop:1850 length:1806 start_codon:yes stop_codon:yes gene_type:complete